MFTKDGIVYLRHKPSFAVCCRANRSIQLGHHICTVFVRAKPELDNISMCCVLL